MGLLFKILSQFFLILAFLGLNISQSFAGPPSSAFNRFHYEHQFKEKQKKQLRKKMVSGTGFYVAKNHVVTNNHVIKSCKNVVIKSGGHTSTAKVIAKDHFNDLAVLKTTKTSHAIASLKRSDRINVGQAITMVGYTGTSGMRGLTRSGTGKVLSTQESLKGLEKVHFSNIANHGDSGAPLIDQNGAVIGVVAKKSAVGVKRLKSGGIKRFLSSVAISNFRLRGFLNKHAISYQQRNNNHANVKDYIVNIQCAQSA